MRQQKSIYCKNGHEYTPENTHISQATGWRQCKECWRINARNRTKRKALNRGTVHNKFKTHCKRGHEFTPKNTYVSRSGNGRAGRGCRKCRDEYCKAYYSTNRNDQLNYAREYKYGPGSCDRYEQLLIEQEGLCAICHQPQEPQSRKTKLHQDHDHITNQLRGLLCDTCNGGLGYFKENPAYLQNAISYLAKWKSSSAVL